MRLMHLQVKKPENGRINLFTDKQVTSKGTANLFKC